MIVTVTLWLTSSAAGVVMMLVVAVRSAVHGPESGAMIVIRNWLLWGTTRLTGSPGHDPLPQVTTAIRPGAPHTASSRTAPPSPRAGTPGAMPR